MISTLAMHAPDGFLSPAVAAVMGIVAATVTWLSLRAAGATLADKYVPLAGVCAAFIFAAQMINVPVGAGTSGHLLGGALAAILLGPWLGSLVVTVVVVVQALLFADGGLTALGYNVVNMAIVPAFSAWALLSILTPLLPKNRSGLVAAGSIAAGLSVVLAAGAFAIEWLFGATAAVPFDTVFGAMVSVHVAIGVIEGLITGMVLAAVLSSRPDIVEAARGLPAAMTSPTGRMGLRPFVIASLLATVTLAVGVSQIASTSPDGLTTVAARNGIQGSEEPHVLASSMFADYATEGVDNKSMSLAAAGLTGVTLTLLVGAGMVASARALKRDGGS